MKQIRAVMVGLDLGGRTTMLYKLKLGENVTTIPTIGFNVETLQYKDAEITLWDIGGQDKIRLLWRHYFANAHAFIYVVDSTDKARFEVAREALHGALQQPDLNDAVLILFANKQDLPNAANPEEVCQAMHIDSSLSRKWAVFGCSAITGEGLNAGLDWMVANVTVATPPPQPESEDEKKGSTQPQSSPENPELKHMKAKLEAISKIVNASSTVGSMFIEELKKILAAQYGDKLLVDPDGTVHVTSHSS